MFYGERFVTRYAGTGRGMYTRNIILKWEWGRGLAGAHNFRLGMLIKTNIQYNHSLSMFLSGKCISQMNDCPFDVSPVNYICQQSAFLGQW